MIQTTQTIAEKQSKGTIYFDASCGLCTSATRRLRNLVGDRFAFVPLQTPGVAKVLGLPPDQPFEEIKLRQPGGQVLGGVAALVEIIRQIWWMYPAWLIFQIPAQGCFFSRFIAWSPNTAAGLAMFAGFNPPLLFATIFLLIQK